ncbi:hypothetical protein GCM10009570_05880 [Dietzia natronolimnaea]
MTREPYDGAGVPDSAIHLLWPVDHLVAVQIDVNHRRPTMGGGPEWGVSESHLPVLVSRVARVRAARVDSVIADEIII